MTIGSILGYVAYVISIVSAILTVRQSNKLLETKAELQKVYADREMWSDRAIDRLQEVAIKDQHISRLKETIKALEGEKKIDERRDRENSCCGKCVLPVLLPRHECRREKSHH